VVRPARAHHCLDGFSVTLCHDPTIRGTRPLWPGPRWRKEGQGERPDADVTRLDLEGSVHHHPPEDKAQEWRAAIRKVAREMGWRIQTGYRSDVGLVWAYRRDFEFQDPEVHDEAAARDLDERWLRARDEQGLVD
jgi:hypothetical protein